VQQLGPLNITPLYAWTDMTYLLHKNGVSWGYTSSRAPSPVISPYARRGVIDHQILSHDAHNKFIEDVFLGGQRLDPKTDGRPDPRPDVRETNPMLGDLSLEFDFRQPPRAPELLPVNPAPGPASTGPS
jgi:phospholipase C